MAEATKPVKSDYDRVEVVSRWKNRVIIGSTIVTLGLTLDEKYKLSALHTVLRDYVTVIVGLNVMLIVLYVGLDFRENQLFSEAERKRTLQYIDNSFDTNFGGKKLEGYFTQEKLDHGFYKFSVNCYENTFHSYNIVKDMQAWVYGRAAAVLLVFVFSAAVGEKSIVRYLSEAVLPLALVQSAVKLAFLMFRLNSLQETFAAFFTSVRDGGFEKREPEAVKNIITYETTLAWASTPLDSAIFNKRKDELAQQWEELKTQLHIKNSLSE